MISTLITSIASIDPLLLAQTSTDSIPPEAYRRASSLTMMFAILCIILIVILALIVMIRRRRRRVESLPKQDQPTEHVDAWAEAGRRLDDSIVEIDPDEDDD